MHASASHVEIFFNSQSGRIDLTIQDNGLGFEPANIDAGRLGLSIMSDRIQNIGGTLETISRKGEGTLIKIAWTAPIN
jgi:signal transduction histidine kinase